MKSILSFRTGAVALGLVLAFAGSAFTQADQNEVRALYWFSTNPSGDPLEPLMNEPECDGKGDYCAKQYNSSDIVFDSNGDPVSVISGHEDNQVATRLRD